MSLGSIAHMQYYFARTGLLDGKGGQLAKDNERKKRASSSGKENTDPSELTFDGMGSSSLGLNDDQSYYTISESGHDPSVVESPSELDDRSDYWAHHYSEPAMLPPTVSTYKQKPAYTEPLPDMPVLRRELRAALQDACQVLEETQKTNESGPFGEGQGDGFYEIQGLHLLDIITLAIRAARNYYTAHTNPSRLYALKSERAIRADLYTVLDMLKRMAGRNFRGGVRLTELTDMILWIESIDQLLKREEEQEHQEALERESWTWREGDWAGREREREWLFLKSFDRTDPPLPHWSEPLTSQTVPDDSLLALQDGQRLIQLHNALVARSSRKFGDIKSWHADVGKPYRMAENLRYWIKASELRWEIKLSVPVTDVVNNRSAEAWRAFDQAILTWSKGVREELMAEWDLESAMSRKKPPALKVDFPSSDDTAATEILVMNNDTDRM